MVIGAALAVYLAFKFYDPVIITSTSVLGAYALVRGVGMYAGHYYGEFEVVAMIKAGLAAEIDPFYWGYVAGFLIFSIAGILVQRKRLKKKLAREKVRRLMR
jgi:hypothetical protein